MCRAGLQKCELDTSVCSRGAHYFSQQTLLRLPGDTDTGFHYRTLELGG